MFVAVMTVPVQIVQVFQMGKIYWMNVVIVIVIPQMIVLRIVQENGVVV